MNSREFVYWLQGLFELANPEALDKTQTDMIKRHLALVFVHEIDPSYSADPVIQQELQDVHDGAPSSDPAKPRPRRRPPWNGGGGFGGGSGLIKC